MNRQNFNKAAIIPLEELVNEIITKATNTYNKKFYIHESIDKKNNINHIIITDNNNLQVKENNQFILFDSIDDEVKLYELNQDDVLISHIKYNNVDNVKNHINNYIVDRFLNIEFESYKKTHIK